MTKSESKTEDQKNEALPSKSKGANDLGEVFEFARNSIKAAAPVSAALGSIVTLLYCLRIGYLPIDGLESIATLGATVALTAAIFLLSFFLLLAVPIGVTHWGLNGLAKEALTAWFFVKNGLVGTGAEPANSPSLGKILALTVSVSSSTWIGLFLFSSASQSLSTSYWIYAWRAALVVGIVVILWYVLFGGEPGSWCRNALIRLFGVIVWAGANVYALMPVALWPSFAGLELEKPWYEFAYVAVSGFLLWFIYGIHLAAQLNPREQRDAPWKISLMSCALIAAIVLPVTLTQPRFHDWLMSRTSVRMADVQLALKPDACAMLRANGIAVSKSASAEKDDEKVVGCLLTDATVLLRIGGRWPVSICEQSGAQGAIRKFTISSEHIASWTKLAEKSKVSDATASAKKMCIL